MDNLLRELGIPSKNIFSTTSPNLYTVVVHNCWLKKWLKNKEVDNSLNNVDFPIQPGESVPYPWRKIFIRILSKKVSKVLPLPRYKLNEGASEPPLTFSQLLQYVAQSNHRNLWKESYKKYCQNNTDNSKESAIVNLMEHDSLLSEVILRLYGCNIIRIKCDTTGKFIEYKEIIPNKYVSKSYETHVNLLSALFTLETDANFFIVYQGHLENSLLDSLNFSPNLLDMNYNRGLFVIYQLLNVSKALSDRGLSLGPLTLDDIFLTENLWLQILPGIVNNVHQLDASLIYEHTKSKPLSVPQTKKSEDGWRNVAVQLEKLCMLWVQGRISNLDYLLHLNVLAGRNATDPQAHFIVPWVTDFSSRCGRNWRDLSKSKYRLTKGDRQLDMTYDVSHCPGQAPHHVADPLSDITCYVYLARRTPKEVLCKYVRNKWVPAEYPASIQRMQEWTPDECVPEFYTEPAVFRSVHEDLPDLGVPSWASCVEDFIVKHREALESTYVSDNLHHWIDLTFGYKMSGPPAVKCKNVNLSLVDGHTDIRKGAAVQLFCAPHPPRGPRTPAPPPAPPRLHWTSNLHHKKPLKSNDSSDDQSDEEEESSSLPQHVSRLSVPTNRVRSRHKSSNRARSLSKSYHDVEHATTNESRASSHSRHYRVQKSELGKGIIYLPKEFNPVASIQSLETLHNFKTKCFFSKAEDAERPKENASTLNLLPMQDTNDTKPESDDNAFTNHMFLASYEHNYLKKFTQDAHLDALKERKNRGFNSRYTAGAAVYKAAVAAARRQDMLVVGCLIVEIFLHSHMRPLRCNFENFLDRYNCCRTVLKHNFGSLPKCVSYVASVLLNVQPPSLSFRNELIDKYSEEAMKKIIVTDKGLPPPTPAQLLQPLLMQHLIPFPKTFGVLYNLLSTLHEYEITSNELNIIYMYECDGAQCEKYQNVDKTKLYYSQKIAEGKIQACAKHLDVLLSQVDFHNQCDALDIFLTHYIELLNNKETSVLAAWYLFDTVSKALGPEQSRKKLLKHILNLYEDDDFVVDKLSDAEGGSLTASKHKFVKLYHNIFLLQLMVRLGLQCFLDNFTQHLVEAVGGYKDATPEIGSPGHLCRNRKMSFKKPRYSDDNVKNALSTTSDIFSPDTSYGSEQMATPNDKPEYVKEKDVDNRSENELFHFESDKERLPSRSSRSKSPAESIDSLNAPSDVKSPSPSDVISPLGPTDISPNHFAKVTKDNSDKTSPSDKPMSMFTSYIHFAEEDVELRNDPTQQEDKSQNLSRPASIGTEAFPESNSVKISDMSSESLIWLAHRLGPVLTCRYITRNLLKMLTLCYIGKENLAPLEGDYEKDEYDAISIANSRVVGDINAMKVIKCLTAMVAMYGEQLILFQYLPHAGELIASCRRRLSAPLEGGAVAVLQLLKHLLPRLADADLMQQLQDTFLSTLLHPALRLLSTTRCAMPSGVVARAALTRKWLDAFYALAVRVGPEVTRQQLCTPALQRFFLIFDKASGKIENWPKQESETGSETRSTSSDPEPNSTAESFLELCRDGSTASWAVRGGRVVRQDAPPDVACSPPARHDPPAAPHHDAAQEELSCVFSSELATAAHASFARLCGAEPVRRALRNPDTVLALVHAHTRHHAVSPPVNIKDRPFQSSFSDEPISRKNEARSDVVMDHISSSNSFGSNVTLVGNRIDVCVSDAAVDTAPVASVSSQFDVVAYKADQGAGSSRHLRGDWLIYWEHEIGRPDKENRFNLKQIKLQTFVGHSHSVKSICCLDNEHAFMSGSKDKTVRLWSLRNQGDGTASSQCNWTYTGHKKGVLSLAFLEASRLAVSTDSVVHIWDPFVETVVNQLDNIKVPISIVRTLPGPSTAVVAATTDATLKIIDARTCNYTHDLKVPGAASSFIRCMCTAPGGSWLAAGLAGGHVAVLDARTGKTRVLVRPHDSEVLRLAAVDERRILSSGLDQTTVLWSVDDGEIITHLKGPTEPVHCLALHGDELISGTTNNRLGVHSALRPDAAFSSTKLRSDTLKGVLTTMCVLPINRLLLLGSDNGSISLIC